MNAICEAQLCQFVVVLQKVLKLQKKTSRSERRNHKMYTINVPRHSLTNNHNNDTTNHV